MSPGPRILQVLADTDESPVNLAAVDLHAALASGGAEPRTVALAPGRTGGLAAVVPAIAPGRRTIAALTGLRNEARWADVVLFHGSAALPPGVDRLRSFPVVLLRLPPGDVVPGKRLARLAGRAPVTLLDDGGAPGTVDLPEGVRRTVVPSGASAATTADLVLVTVGELGSSRP